MRGNNQSYRDVSHTKLDMKNIHNQNEFARVCRHIRAGFLDVQRNLPFNPDYDKWAQKDQFNYESGRMTATNIMKLLGKKDFLKLQWKDENSLPQDINYYAALAKQELGQEWPGDNITLPIDAALEAHTAGYDKRRGLPLPIPTVRES